MSKRETIKAINIFSINFRESSIETRRDEDKFFDNLKKGLPEGEFVILLNSSSQDTPKSIRLELKGGEELCKEEIFERIGEIVKEAIKPPKAIELDLEKIRPEREEEFIERFKAAKGAGFLEDIRPGSIEGVEVALSEIIGAFYAAMPFALSFPNTVSDYIFEAEFRVADKVSRLLLGEKVEFYYRDWEREFKSRSLISRINEAVIDTKLSRLSRRLEAGKFEGDCLAPEPDKLVMPHKRYRLENWDDTEKEPLDYYKPIGGENNEEEDELYNAFAKNNSTEEQFRAVREPLSRAGARSGAQELDESGAPIEEKCFDPSLWYLDCSKCEKATRREEIEENNGFCEGCKEDG